MSPTPTYHVTGLLLVLSPQGASRHHCCEVHPVLVATERYILVLPLPRGTSYHHCKACCAAVAIATRCIMLPQGRLCHYKVHTAVAATAVRGVVGCAWQWWRLQHNRPHGGTTHLTLAALVVMAAV